jgi:hypothetical protein
LRNVTQDDYLVRALSLPAKYGVIAKAYIEPTKAQSMSAGESNSAITAGTLAATATTYAAATVDAATSRAIDGAIAVSQFGNVGGIVRAYQSGTAVLD